MKEIGWRGMGKQALGVVLITSITLSLILWKTWQQSTWDIIDSFRWNYLGIGVLLLLCSLLCDIIRVKAMTKAAGHTIAWCVGLRTVLSGYFVASVTPFLAGGAPVQAYSLYRGGVPLGIATTIVLTSGFLAQFSLAVLAGIVLFGLNMVVSPNPTVQMAIRWGLLIYTCCLVSFFFVVWHIQRFTPVVKTILRVLTNLKIISKQRRESWIISLTEFLQELGRSFRQFFSGELKYVFVGAIAYLGLYMCIFSVAPVLLWGMGKDVNLVAMIGLQIPVYLLVSIVPTPGGSGGLEAGMAMAFSSYLAGSELGIFVAAWRLLNLYYHLVGGGLGLFLLSNPSPYLPVEI